jgi:L-lactate dehydrogenase complex protein LldE
MADAVQLFSTCLAEQFFPAAVDAAATVLERRGLKVRMTPRAFCCGQVAFNEGLRDEARELALLFLDGVDPQAPIVIPSGSCATMVKIFYRDLLAAEPALARRAQALGARVFEFSQFLVNELKITDVGARFERAVTYHPSCHLLRELGARDEPMRLLSAVRGIRLCELRDREECCGFGGLFAVKFPHISAAMMEDKLERVAQSGAEVLVANDCGCLMHLAGGASRRAMRLQTMHLAQVLASR